MSPRIARMSGTIRPLKKARVSLKTLLPARVVKGSLPTGHDCSHSFRTLRYVLAQREMENWRCSVSVGSAPSGRGFSRHEGLSSDDFLASACNAGEGPPALLSIGSMSLRVIPQHGCVPAVPASVSPGKIIVAPQRPAVSQCLIGP